MDKDFVPIYNESGYNYDKEFVGIADVARRVLTLIYTMPGIKNDTIASRLDLHPIEVTEVMAKAMKLGLFKG